MKYIYLRFDIYLKGIICIHYLLILYHSLAGKPLSALADVIACLIAKMIPTLIQNGGSPVAKRKSFIYYYLNIYIVLNFFYLVCIF